VAKIDLLSFPSHGFVNNFRYTDTLAPFTFPQKLTPMEYSTLRMHVAC